MSTIIPLKKNLLVQSCIILQRIIPGMHIYEKQLDIVP